MKINPTFSLAAAADADADTCAGFDELGQPMHVGRWDRSQQFADAALALSIQATVEPQHVGQVTFNQGHGLHAAKPSQATRDELAATEPTVAAIRNIACKYQDADVAEILDQAGFSGRCSDVHVPLNPGRVRPTNLGYAFVTFSNAAAFQECREAFEGKCFGQSRSAKKCEVVLASDPKGRRSSKAKSRAQTRPRNRS